jgi:hypothetical protein
LVDIGFGLFTYRCFCLRARNTIPRYRCVDISERSGLYRTRQEINEHIFGTIKRQWGYNHTNLTGLEKVNGEHSLIMLVYNIKRTINILGVPDLIDKLKNWKSPYKAKVISIFKTAYSRLFNDLFGLDLAVTA